QAAEHTLYNQYEEKIRPCIDLVDSLRALGIEKDLSLPAIAVIGDQSSGKSSVLEALSGVALPRGNGIVTRCPLELKLKRLPEGQAWQGKISYRNVTQELQDPSEVDTAIRHAQDVVAGPRGAISGQLISLEVRSPDVPDLTLIDLPGIARVAVGDQPKDIGDQVKLSLMCQSVPHPLRVPSRPLSVAVKQLVNKHAQRVLGSCHICTSMAQRPFLCSNCVIQLVKTEQSISAASLPCTAWLSKPTFSFFFHRTIMKQGKATIPHLAEKLTNELVKHIIKTLPALESQIRDILHATLQDLQRYNRGTPQTEDEKLFFLTDVSITVGHRAEQGGNCGRKRNYQNISMDHQEVCGIHHFTIYFTITAKKTVPGRVWKYEDQYRGREFPGFSNYKTFEDIIKEQIRELEEPAIQILNNVMKLVEEKFMELAKRNFANFHNLSRVAKVKIEDIREKQAAEAERHIRAQFKMERVVYCQDDLYLSDLNTFKAENAALGKDQQSAVVAEMASHTSAYFSVSSQAGASKRLSNQIPLIILSSVLHDFGENVQTSMLQLLQEKEKLNFLLEEDTEAAKTRNYLSQRVDRLTKACQYLRDFSLL
ncbi:MX protein, partial [Buphagus erythrorhynchus]|nr:MX protein [Buphagus erythrorhynchus]